MGVHETHACQSASQGVNQHVRFSLTYNILFFILLLPLGTWFARKFWREVNADSSIPKLTRIALNALVITSTITLWCGAYSLVVFPLIRVPGTFGMWHGAANGCVLWLSYATALTCTQRILLERLKVVFANSTQPVTARVANTFDLIQATYLLWIAAVVYAWTNPCFVHVTFNELPNKLYYICRSNNRFALALLLFYPFLMCGNLALVWMFVWRLKAVFIEANYAQQQSNCQSQQRMPALVLCDSDVSGGAKSLQGSIHVTLALDLTRKSTVVAIWSVLSSLLVVATWRVSSRILAPQMDVVINAVLIYCLFSADGDKLYDKLFGFCHFTVDCILPKRALQIETGVEQKFEARNEPQILVEATDLTLTQGT